MPLLEETVPLLPQTATFYVQAIVLNIVELEIT